MNVYLLISLASVLSFSTADSQSINTKTGIADTSVHKSKQKAAPLTTFKWTRQLPVAIKNAFNKSRYNTWFIEKMVSYNSNGKIIYRFYVNNGNLLDGDHHDSFLESDSLDIGSDGTILSD